MLTDEEKLTYIAAAMETLASRIDDVATSEEDYDDRLSRVADVRADAIDEIGGLLE